MGVAVSAGENEVSVKPGNTGRLRDAARTRTALLDAAREVFLRDGYAAAATEEIVSVAGVTRGALYHHFADKRDLFRGVIERLQSEAESSLVPAEPVEDAWGASPRPCSPRSTRSTTPRPAGCCSSKPPRSSAGPRSARPTGTPR
ncbi:TetR/AcrR family transcriptional regulator [Rhodococcus pyridinivorans]|uniref:TetR/AcrR family transcriptional regulator n=1 Tax=Rhodococcus pyridinivorans TaxID=103816 RepID=UPI001F567495|nr:TetR/AcrR family transcriptional regulator [Rhodococcus pyridinivorans]